MFQKLKQFVKKLFSKQKLIEEKSVIKKDGAKKIVKSDIKTELQVDSQIYNLQKLYEDGKITEDDLTIKQIKDLIKLYKEGK